MARRVLVRWSFPVLILAVVSACSGGRSASSAPAPATARGGTSTPAEPARPATRGLTYPAIEGYLLALDRGTRTRTGQPGPQYWQQWSDYKLRGGAQPRLEAADRQGHDQVLQPLPRHSPRRLRAAPPEHLRAWRAPRHQRAVVGRRDGAGPVAAQGTDSHRRRRRGSWLRSGRHDHAHASAQAAPARAASADFAFDWRLRVPPDGAPRGGQDGEVYFISYWYPQMAVYDDVNGWQIDQYLGNAEFYMGYGNYDVSLTRARRLARDGDRHAAEPRRGAQRRRRAPDSTRRARAPASSTSSPTATASAGKSTTAGTNGKLTWRFRADNVRDVAWAASARYLWDATTAAVGDVNGDGRPDTSLITRSIGPSSGSTTGTRAPATDGTRSSSSPSTCGPIRIRT